MEKIIFFAQKGLIFNKEKTHILVNRFLESEYVADRLPGKYGLPGGRVKFGEDLNKSFIQKVKDKTGITVRPILPFHTYSWIYMTETTENMIIANAILSVYESGEILEPTNVREVVLEKAEWLEFKSININDFIDDEREVLVKCKEYLLHNPFTK
jgi:ADP-ribose pyrophosphatase YjhB (NUDIX family)